MASDILIVDDEADIRELVAGLLEDEGHETRTAGNSDAAMQAFTDRVPRLVFLDIWLQGSRLDGLDLLDVMARKQPPSPLLLLLPRPLLDAMAQNSARPEQRALLDRCSSLLRHRLCKLHLAKADPWDAKALPPASLLAEMQQVLHPPPNPTPHPTSSPKPNP